MSRYGFAGKKALKPKWQKNVLYIQRRSLPYDRLLNLKTAQIKKSGRFLV